YAQDPALFGNHQGDQDQIDRQTCRTSGKGGHQNGDQPFLPIFDGPGGHNGRNGTGVPGDQRHHAFATEPKGPHQAVHQKNHSANVPGLFQEGNEEEQKGDLGDKDHNSPYSGHNALGQEIGERPRGEIALDPFTGLGEHPIDKVHGIAAPFEDGLEDQQQDGKEYQVTKDLMGQNFIDGCPKPFCLLKVNGVIFLQGIVDQLVAQGGFPVLQFFEGFPNGYGPLPHGLDRFPVHGTQTGPLGGGQP